MPLTPQSSDDFALLHASTRSLPDRSRWAVLWMMGLAVLIVGAVMALVWYLDHFETAEEERRRGADAQWLEQNVQFHFRRLEYDLAQRARQAALDPAQALRDVDKAQDAPAGLLWRASGVVLTQAWIASQGASGGDVFQWQEDQALHADNYQTLQTLQDIAGGLRRASYAGPMRRTDGSVTDRVWLGVPYFDGSRLVGIYVAQLSMQQAVQALLPAWFLQSQTVRLVVDAVAPPSAPQAHGPYRTVMNLPDTDLLLEVVPQGSQSSPVPRFFFVVALLFLLGMLASLAALRRDFVKRQQMQQRLLAEVALRSAMERSVAIGMRAWDMQGTILYVNEAFCSMVGFSAQELRGASAPLPYWPANQIDEIAILHRRVIHQGTLRQGIEVQFRHRNGERVDVLIHEAPLLAADGTQLGWMSSVLDISERKRAQQLAALQQEKLEASGRLVAVGEVASTLAHELNQPLGALASFAAGLLNRLQGESITTDEVRPVVQRIAQLAERAGGVIQRVNAFARKRELQLTQVDLVPLVRRAVVGAQESRDTPVVLDLPEHSVRVQGDALLLEHLVQNLCGNALDWACRGAARPQVCVRLRQDAAGAMELSVADSGSGVPLDARARIFDAFFSTKEGGMGMGLAICRSIVEAHHGRIEVGSDPELGGARFTVWLPLVPAAPAERGEAA
ncbi:MAG: PAS domain S-box protein [Giesbergeria sp.]|nr:PAS domain S-box protein [Giesbergeria sp.]MBP6159142.1 PAS domain S-box protein [Giesbergeria sp.]MBP7082943.1 PAS domain S-box protein [Giesbergeria sp.]MBP9785263.1 PAS domain S-box protein [Giesbergeria sp.]